MYIYIYTHIWIHLITERERETETETLPSHWNRIDFLNVNLQDCFTVSHRVQFLGGWTAGRGPVTASPALTVGRARIAERSARAGHGQAHDPVDGVPRNRHHGFRCFPMNKLPGRWGPSFNTPSCESVQQCFMSKILIYYQFSYSYRIDKSQ